MAPDTSKTLNGRGDRNTIGGFALPTRASKLMPLILTDLQWVMVQDGKGGHRRIITPSDYQNTQVHDPANYAAGLTDYIYVELKGRGLGGLPLRKKFLVNPSTISAHYDVKDSESLARGGWMVGIWGELGTVSVSGQTAGRYFASRLVDATSPLSPSYRDLLDLVAVYENNGNFYEGETANQDMIPLSASRKQIQGHADVTLRFGNFIWDGYFTDLKIDDVADKPYTSKFTFGFQMLRERYASSSPWRSSLVPEVRYRGHAYELVQAMLTPNNPSPADKQAAAGSQNTWFPK